MKFHVNHFILQIGKKSFLGNDNKRNYLFKGTIKSIKTVESERLIKFGSNKCTFYCPIPRTKRFSVGLYLKRIVVDYSDLESGMKVIKEKELGGYL